MKTGIKNQIVIVSAVAAVLLIVMSVCAIAESITFEKVAVLAASVLALNKCCGIDGVPCAQILWMRPKPQQKLK